MSITSSDISLIICLPSFFVIATAKSPVLPQSFHLHPHLSTLRNFLFLLALTLLQECPSFWTHSLMRHFPQNCCFLSTSFFQFFNVYRNWLPCLSFKPLFDCLQFYFTLWQGCPCWDHTDAYIAWKCLKAVMHIYTSSMCLIALLVRHPQSNIHHQKLIRKEVFPSGPTIRISWLWLGLFLLFSSIMWDLLHLFLMLSGHFK